MCFQELHGVDLKLLRMLPEPPGKSEIFSGRVFPRIQTALHSHLQENGVQSSRIAISSVFGQMLLLSRQIANLKVVFRVRNLVNSFHWIYSICCTTVPSESNFCSLDSCASYHRPIRYRMILMLSLHTVDPMLSPLYLLRSDFDSVPFQRVLSLELP